MMDLLFLELSFKHVSVMIHVLLKASLTLEQATNERLVWLTTHTCQWMAFLRSSLTPAGM